MKSEKTLIVKEVDVTWTARIANEPKATKAIVRDTKALHNLVLAHARSKCVTYRTLGNFCDFL